MCLNCEKLLAENKALKEEIDRLRRIPYQSRWDPPELARLQQMIDDKKTYNEIAYHYGIERRTLMKVISEFGLRGVRPRKDKIKN